MSVFVLAIDQYIIKENQHIFPKQRFEHVIHPPLERCGNICKPKGHYKKLIVTSVSLCYFIKITSMDYQLSPKIQLTENCSSS